MDCIIKKFTEIESQIKNKIKDDEFNEAAALIVKFKDMKKNLEGTVEINEP